MAERGSARAAFPTAGSLVRGRGSVRESANPDETLMEFLQSTYEAAARLAGWDRAALERSQGGGNE